MWSKTVIISIIIVMLLIQVVVYYRKSFMYQLSRRSSACEDVKGSVQICNGVYVNKEDASHPATMLRLGWSWWTWMAPLIDMYCSRDRVAIDVGAHLGLQTAYMAGKSREVYAFEPRIDHYNVMRMNIAEAKNVVALNVQVGNENKGDGGGSDKMVRLDDMGIETTVGFVVIEEGFNALEVVKGMQNMISMWKPKMLLWDMTDAHGFLERTYGYRAERIKDNWWLAY